MRRFVHVTALALVAGLLAAGAPAASGSGASGPARSLAPVAGALAPLSAVAVPEARAARKKRNVKPTQNAFFNTPRPWGGKAENDAILTQVEKAIRRTPGPTKYHPEPTITVATYLLDRTTSVTALIEACKRGVGVRVILDEDIANRNMRRLISALNGDNIRDTDGDGKADSKPRTGRCGQPKKGAKASRDRFGRVLPEPGPALMSRQQALASLDLPTGASRTWGQDRSYVKRCDGACRNAGSGGNMHSKFYLFSKTGSSRHVVMVSSSNLNRGGANSGWNDMYLMRERKKTYNFYLMVHRAMTQERRASTASDFVNDGPLLSRFFPIRNGGKKTDPTLADLNTVRCRSALGPTEIYVSMFYWKGSRGNYLADRLLELGRNGCKVNAIYGAPSRQIAERLRNAATAGTINLWDSRWDHDLDGYNEVRTHAKYVLIKGTFRGSDRAHVVMTGTQNWVGGSLSLGDENSINIRLKSAYLDYRRNWDDIRNHSRRLPYSRYR